MKRKRGIQWCVKRVRKLRLREEMERVQMRAGLRRGGARGVQGCSAGARAAMCEGGEWHLWRCVCLLCWERRFDVWNLRY